MSTLLLAGGMASCASLSGLSGGDGKDAGAHDAGHAEASASASASRAASSSAESFSDRDEGSSTGSRGAETTHNASSTRESATASSDAGAHDAGRDAPRDSARDSAGDSAGDSARDSARDAEPSAQAILFSGFVATDSYGDGRTLADTWSFDGATWTKVAGAGHPPARTGASGALFEGGVFVFGGSSNGAYLNDTWSFADGTWTEVSDGVGVAPSERDAAGLAPLGANLVLFGGLSAGDAGGLEYLDDTWSWDGTIWTEAHPSASPPGRGAAVMVAFDGKVVLFGGASSTLLNDTWTWDGDHWTAESPAHSPPARSFAMAAVAAGGGDGDSSPPVLVVFGGVNETTPLNDTWTWDGLDWTERHPPAAPAARSDGMMATVAGGALLFGGAVSTGSGPGYTTTDLADSWLWNGTTWSELHPPGPSARSDGVLVGLAPAP